MTKLFSNNFYSIFDEVENLMFTRPIKDMHPIKWVKSEDGYIGYCITTGIKPECVEVSAKDGYIQVKGYTKYEEFGEEFSQSFSVKVNPDIYKNIESLDYTSKDGVTRIYLSVKKSNIGLEVSPLPYFIKINRVCGGNKFGD